MAYLLGEQADFEILADRFPAGRDSFWFVQRQDGVWLQVVTASEMEDVVTVDARAREILPIINGAVGLLDSSFHPVELARRYRDADGQVTSFMGPLRFEIRFHPKVTLSVVEIDGSVTPEPRLERERDLVELAIRVPEVGEVLGLLSDPRSAGFITLYKAFEIVMDAVGGRKKIVGNGWATTADINAFTASANRPDVSGIAARHARQPGLPPNRTMNESQAQP